MGRRRFVKGLSAVGVSTFTTNFITQEALAEVTEDPKEEIPYVAYLRRDRQQQDGKPERTPVYDTISAREWGRRRAAENAADRVRDQVTEATGVTVYLSYGESNTENIEIKVERAIGPSSEREAVTSIENLRAALPKEVDGQVEAPKNNPAAGRTITDIPVIVSDENRVKPANCGDYYGDDYSPIPGGCQVEQGSICSPAYSIDLDEYVMVSAGHVVNNGDTSQGGGDTDLNSWVSNTSDGNDYGYYRKYSNEIFEYELAEDDAIIEGIVTWDKIKNEVGNSNYDVSKQGGRTGNTSGHVAEIANTDIPIYKTSCTGHYGDSGGTIYHREEVSGSSDNIYILGPIGYGWSTDGKDRDDECPSLEQMGGNPMEYIENQANILI